MTVSDLRRCVLYALVAFACGATPGLALALAIHLDTVAYEHQTDCLYPADHRPPGGC